MPFQRAARIARAILEEEDELRGDLLTIVDKVAKAAAAAGTHQAIAKALRGHVRQADVVAGRILRGDVKRDETSIDLSRLGDIEDALASAIETAIRQAGGGSVRKSGDRFAIVARRLAAHVEDLSPAQRVAVLECAQVTTNGRRATETSLVRIASDLARDVGLVALPWVAAVAARYPDNAKAAGCLARLEALR